MLASARGVDVHAADDPDRLAMIGPDGRRLTFGRLGVRVNRLTNALRDAGLGAGDVVAVLLHNSVEFLEVLLATSQAGLYFVPINTHLAPPEIEYIPRDSGAKALIA